MQASYNPIYYSFFYILSLFSAINVMIMLAHSLPKKLKSLRVNGFVRDESGEPSKSTGNLQLLLQDAMIIWMYVWLCFSQFLQQQKNYQLTPKNKFSSYPSSGQVAPVFSEKNRLQRKTTAFSQK